jgi:transposase
MDEQGTNYCSAYMVIIGMIDSTTRMKCIIHYRYFNHSLRRVATIYGVSRSSVSRWVKADESEPLHGCKRPTLAESISTDVKRIVTERPYARLDDVRDTLACRGVFVSRSTVHRSLKTCRFSYKRSQRDDGLSTPSKAHPFFYSRALSRETNAIAVDETCFYLNDCKRYGWAPINSRLRKRRMASRIKVSVALAIDRFGVVDHHVIRGNFNTRSFASFIARLPKNRSIVLDNVAFHKAVAVRDIAERNSMELQFTPPYCPWFNPTEFAFSATKARYRRKMCDSDVSMKDLPDFVTTCLDTLTADKCSAFFKYADMRAMECARVIGDGE